MFLIQYEENSFVNGEHIQWINMRDGKITFAVLGDIESSFCVKDEFKDKFLNHLQAINSNMDNIQSLWGRK